MYEDMHVEIRQLIKEYTNEYYNKLQQQNIIKYEEKLQERREEPKTVKNKKISGDTRQILGDWKNRGKNGTGMSETGINEELNGREQQREIIKNRKNNFLKFVSTHY